MALHTTLPERLNEVDVIVVGGGTAGCVVASRLADSDRSLSILVVESGPNNLGVPTVTYPALYGANFAPGSGTLAAYTSRNEPQLLGRDISIAVGNCLGGGSSINGLIYARPQAVDFDSWRVKGWSSDDLLPYLKRFETYHSQDTHERHGSEGPIHISGGRYRGTSLERDFIDATTRLGYPEVQDLQDLDTANGVSPAFRYVSPEDGRRQDSAHRYLHPRIQQDVLPNLNVLVGSQVTRILLSESRNVEGVEYRLNTQISPQSVQTVRARKLVIISAGAFGTPLLLERSGIGDRDILARAGVPLFHHLPGVGRHFQDHQCSLFTYKSNSPHEDNFESIYNGTRNLPELMSNHDPLLSWNAVDASAKIRPTRLEVESLGPTFEQAWDTDYEDVPNKPLVSMILFNGILGDPTVFPKGEYFTIVSYTPYPYSRGHIHITGAHIDQAPDFQTGYLTDQGDIDLEIQAWAYKKQREIAQRMRSLRSEIPNQHPAFPQNSKAKCTSSGDVQATGHITTTIKYSNEDDQAIKQFIRGKVGTAWHPLGTCKMAPLEEMGVVDENLSVHGIAGLKIADMSIVPQNVSGNTMSTALLIGERAADILIKELGLGSC
ncbi:GMC oxidoreductase [Nemania abortiva]|nr:GMC oxidoreductase [Nemania abortiva]